MALAPGTRLEHYEIVDSVGVGGMGEVYRATDTKLERDVAVKVLPEVFTRDEERLARFEREAKLLASLNHAQHRDAPLRLGVCIRPAYGRHSYRRLKCTGLAERKESLAYEALICGRSSGLSRTVIEELAKGVVVGDESDNLHHAAALVNIENDRTNRVTRRSVTDRLLCELVQYELGNGAGSELAHVGSLH